MPLHLGWVCPQVLFPQESEAAAPSRGAEGAGVQQGQGEPAAQQSQESLVCAVALHREPGSWLSPCFPGGLGSWTEEKIVIGCWMDRLPGWGGVRRPGAPDPVPEGSPACKSSLVPGGEPSQHRAERGNHSFSLGREASQPGPAGGSHSLPRPSRRLSLPEREEKAPSRGREKSPCPRGDTARGLHGLQRPVLGQRSCLP